VSAGLVDGVERIAVLRSGGLGDLVVAEPALAAVRAAYPLAEISLLGAPHHAALVAGRPGPWDRFVDVPLVPGVRLGSDPDAGAADVEAWCAGQRDHRYDLALQLHGGGGFSNPLVRRLGARLTAGPAAPGAERLDRWLPYAAMQLDGLRWLETVALVGAPPVRLEPALVVLPAERAAARRLLGAPVRPVVAVHPGASEARRRWPVERLAAVADTLADLGAAVLLLGGPGDEALVQGVRRALRAEPLIAPAGTPLPVLLGLLAECALLLGNDSGPRHLAAAVGTPTVGVFSAPNLADVAPLFRTWHRIAVSWRSACEVCGMRMVDGGCGHDATALADVTVSEVEALAVGLWEQVLDAGGSVAA